MANLIAGAEIGGWRLIRQLGRGGNAEVWEAKHREGKEGALKVLHRTGQDRVQRFRDEISFLLEHSDMKGVLPLLDHRLSDELYQPAWYVMPLATPLRVALADDPSPEDVVAAIASVADTLSLLAARGVGHRDIKPENLFERDGEILVGDFGLVTYPEKHPVTRAGRKLGAADYMAPEMRADADRAAAEPADVYALGKTLWVLLTGRELPLPGPHRLDERAYSLATYIDHPHAPELDRLLERMTQHGAEARPSLREVEQELNSWLTTMTEASEGTRTGELEERIKTLIEPDRRAMGRRDALVAQASHAFRELEEVHLQAVHREISTVKLPTRLGSAGFQTVVVEHTPAPDLVQSYGMLSAAHTPGNHPVYLIAAIGGELMADGVLQLLAALVIERYVPNDHHRQTIWFDSRRSLVGSAGLRHAVADLGRGLRERYPEALAAFAEWVEQRPS